MSSYICGLKSVKRGLCTEIQPNIFRTGEPDRSFTMSNYTSVKNERKRKKPVLSVLLQYLFIQVSGMLPDG